MKESGIVNIRGKEYRTVALRVSDFRADFPEHSIVTEILQNEGDSVLVRCTISDMTGRIIATGHAEENRTASQVNRTSAVENCETSAIGRAIALMGGKYMGTEFCSANELENALHQQNPVHSKPVAKVEPVTESSVENLKRRYHAMCDELKITDDLKKEIILHFFDVQSHKELSEEQFSQLCEYIVPKGKAWLVSFVNIARVTKAKHAHVQSSSAMMLHLKGFQELNTKRILDVGLDALNNYLAKISGGQA